MKANEVYRVLREDIGPWAKAQGFKRTRTMLSWYRPHRDLHIVFWFQVSQDGWDDYEGSKFTVEFQLSVEPIVGEVSSFRQRLGQFLDDSSREELRKIQNGIICWLTPPPPDHPFLLDARIREYYLSKFRRESARYTRRDDLWFRYHAPEHLHLWSQFILRHLPFCIEHVEDLHLKSQAKLAGRQGRPWWRFWGQK